MERLARLTFAGQTIAHPSWAGTRSFNCNADDHVIMGLADIARTTRRLPLDRHPIASWIEGRCRCGDGFQVLFRKCCRARDNRPLFLGGGLRANA